MASRKYCSLEQIQNYLLYSVKAYFIPQVEEWIEQMSQYIEKETGRFFIADEAASERLYDGDGSKSIIVNDCIEITKVEVDGVEVDFLQYPSDELPITMIKLEDTEFTSGQQNITVTAKWGYSEEAPSDIAFVCTVLVSGIINKSLSHEGEMSSLSMGRYSVSYKDEKQLEDFENTKITLSNYKRYY